MKPRLSCFPAEEGRGQGRLEDSRKAEAFPCPGPERPSFIGGTEGPQADSLLDPLRWLGPPGEVALGHTPLWAGSWP